MYPGVKPVNENLPSRSLTEPIEVPLIMMFVNGSGSLFLMLYTLPLMEPVCADKPADSESKKSKRIVFNRISILFKEYI
jgi:hypothetical protein